MTITLDSYTFEDPGIHGTPIVPQWEVGKTIQRFFGVVGQYQLTGVRHAHEITIDVHFYNYATMALLLADIATIGTKQETLTGTLTVDLGGGDSSSYTNCIFTGYEPDEPPWKDGSGQNGWQQRGKLRFRQVAS